jgi:WD40 repeat protein
MATSDSDFFSHRIAIFAGTLLASGSADTDIIVWDMITESGLYRLKGHKDGVTGVRFIEMPGSTVAYVRDQTTTPCHQISIQGSIYNACNI